jgi:hypothetical protein
MRPPLLPFQDAHKTFLQNRLPQNGMHFPQPRIKKRQASNKKYNIQHKYETYNMKRGKEQQLLICKWNGARNVNGLMD